MEKKMNKQYKVLNLSYGLESTNAAPEVPHPCLTRDTASDAVARALVRVRVCVFFFFFFSNSRQLSSIHANATRFVPNRLRFAPNRSDSAKIRPYRPYRVVLAGGRYCRNMPETAEIGLEYGQKSRNLHSSFFFCESRHSMCFLRIF